MKTAWLIEEPARALYFYRARSGFGWTSLAEDALHYRTREMAQAEVDRFSIKKGIVVREHLFR